MQLVSVPVGSAGASVGLAVSGGSAIVTISVPVKGEVDALLAAIEAKLPASLTPILAALQAAADAELSQS